METPYAKSPTTITTVGDKALGRSAGLPPHRGLGPQRGLVGDVRAAAVYFTSLRLEIPCEIVLPLLSPTGRHETLAPGNPCDATFPHPTSHVLATPCRAAPCCAPLRRDCCGTLGPPPSPLARGRRRRAALGRLKGVSGGCAPSVPALKCRLNFLSSRLSY